MYSKEEYIMTFNHESIIVILEEIEKAISFKGSDLSDPQDWNFELNLPVEDIIKRSPNESDNIRYVIKIFEMLGYITFKCDDFSIIQSVTDKGIRFLFSEIHNVKFI
jgi:hypothetical protein